MSAAEHEHEQEPLTLADMLETGATYRQLDYWVRRGYLSPRGVALPGSGFNRHWTERDRDLATMILRLSKVLLMEHAVTLAEKYVDEGVHEFNLDETLIVWLPAPEVTNRKEPHGDA